MSDFDYTDLRFIFEKGIPWDKIREAKGGGEDYSQEYLMTLDNTANFCKDKVAPMAEEVDSEECKLESDGNGKNSVRVPQAILDNIEGLKEIGAFCGLTLPEKDGGYGFPLTVFFGMGELISMADSSLGLTPMLQEGVGQVIVEFANDKIKKDYLPKLISGEKICAMGLTEPNAGSDLANMKTVARPVDGSGNLCTERFRELEKSGTVYVLNGSKIFITNGFGDTLALAKTDEGISMFLVDAEDKEVPRIEKKLGIRGSATCELFFEDSPGLLIGELGKGLVPNMLKLMYIARLGTAAQALGIAQRAHVMARNYAINDRVQFGVPIAEHTPVRQIIFEDEINLQASRALMYLASYYFDLREATRERMRQLGEQDPSYLELKKKLARYERIANILICMTKYDAAELSNQITYSSLQVFGGYGFTREYPLERLYRDTRITSIYEGTSQIQLREVFNESYYMEKIGLLNQFKIGEQQRFVETEKNRLFFDSLFDEYKEEIMGMDGASSSIKELLEGIQEMRDCLKISREELFLQERKRSKEDAKKFLALYYKEYADLLAYIFKAYALTRHALLSEHKQKVAKAYIERAIVAATNIGERIKKSVDDLLRDGYCEIISG